MVNSDFWVIRLLYMGLGDGLGVCDGNAAKLGCDDCCTTKNVIKFNEFKKKIQPTAYFPVTHEVSLSFTLLNDWKEIYKE